MLLPLLTAMGILNGSLQAADFHDPTANRTALPVVPPGFSVSVFAQEPLVRQPCSMAFDARGRLYVGMGPQYRNPTPQTPGDSVFIVLDTDGDGRADRTQEFATGFNAIQGLAWHGRDLWIANAPDLTIVRDLDGDDQADEYVRVYTDLGNLEHGLHGLNRAPDGKMYMSKGNSKGLTQPGRVAPRPFRELWGVTAPQGTPDFPPPQTFRRADYRHAYHDPNDDWGREGGVLRCDPDGSNLEIVARGFRNPWDITFDNGFNWLGTDNDQTTGDRVFMPFHGAHFGWNHPWSAHWDATPHAPSAPVSGPLFEGSGTGIVFGDVPSFPASHRGVFFINDWLRKTTFVWRPRWDGSLLRPEGGDWEPFVQGGSSLFRPTDLEFGPDGALWILGWSAGYGAEYADGRMTSEGRVFRVTAAATATTATTATTAATTPARTSTSLLTLAPKRSRPAAAWTVGELLEDFDGPLPVWRGNAQDELLRRGASVKPALQAVLNAAGRSEARETWSVWTLGLLEPMDSSTDDWLARTADTSAASLNLRIQCLRILAHRWSRSMSRNGERILASTATNLLATAVTRALRSPEPRIRFAAVQAMITAPHPALRPAFLPALLDALAVEPDPTTFYAGWQALRRLQDPAGLRSLLAEPRARVRAAVLLAALEDHALRETDVRPLASDRDITVRGVAQLWLQKASGGGEAVVLRGRPLDASATDAGLATANAGHRRQDGSGTLNAAAEAQAGNESAPAPVPGPVIRGLQTRSGARTVFVPGGLRPGARPYADRNYDLRTVPPALVGADYIRTPNNDDGSHGAATVVFEALVPVRVIVGFDTRATAPRWLRDGFQKRGDFIRADHWTFELYAREFPAGRIELGGNTDDGRSGGKGHYLIALEALPLPAPASDAPTRLEDSLAALSQGDRARGEWLFHGRGGAGCFQCHQLQGHGNRFGPDLATIGDRADARHIAQSMLDPNAVLTEGFNQQIVVTDDAEYAGILIEESGLSLTLGLATGERASVPKARIRSRRTAATSAMPAYNAVLTTRHVADLTAYLLAQTASAAKARAAANTAATGTGASAKNNTLGAIPAAPKAPDASTATGVPTPRPAPVWPAGDGFRFTSTDDRLVIAHSGQAVGEFVFRDPRILRPHLANVHAPGGRRATRTHPPVPGADAVDHDTMHPGIWLAFGDISGTDFWRNKGRMEHVRFVAPPAVAEGRLAFATECRLQTADGRTLGWLTNRLTVAAAPEAWLIVWDATFHAGDAGLTFGDQEEMGFGARVATPLTEKNGGRIVSSSGKTTAASTWGQPAAWCDYSGRIPGSDGALVGLTLLAHPGNFRPSWWHNRDYGVFVANPFGRAAMKQGERSTVTVAAGETLRLRFAAAVHATPSGAPPAALDGPAAVRSWLDMFLEATRH